MEIERFSPQMWKPFAEWVSTTYPEDAAVMYTDETHSLERVTDESIRLWRRHVRGYVEAVQSGGDRSFRARAREMPRSPAARRRRASPLDPLFGLNGPS